MVGRNSRANLRSWAAQCQSTAQGPFRRRSKRWSRKTPTLRSKSRSRPLLRVALWCGAVPPASTPETALLSGARTPVSLATFEESRVLGIRRRTWAESQQIGGRYEGCCACWRNPELAESIDARYEFRLSYFVIRLRKARDSLFLTNTPGSAGSWWDAP